MKVERPYPQASELQAVALSGSCAPSAKAFATAVGRHAEKEGGHGEGVRRSEATSSGRATPRAAARAAGGPHNANRLLDAMVDASSGLLIENGRESPLRRTLPDAASSLAAAVADELRRR